MGMKLNIATLFCVLALSCFSEVIGHTSGTDGMAYFDAYRTAGSTCNKNLPVTGWTVLIDRYRLTGSATANNNLQFDAGTGIFTVVEPGVYHCCASFRCKQGGCATGPSKGTEA